MADVLPRIDVNHHTAYAAIGIPKGEFADCKRGPHELIEPVLYRTFIANEVSEPVLHKSFNPDEVGTWQPQNFEIVRKLQDATRNHGEVYLMRDVSADELVAVKKMPTQWICHCHEEFLSYYWYEHEHPWQDIGCTRFLNDNGFKFACELSGVYRDKESTYVVTTFCDIGDMFSWHETLTPPGIERERAVRPILKQLFESVMQLHDLSIVHLDISLENILLTSTLGTDAAGIRLVDFSQADSRRWLRCGVRGKPTYVAPEMHFDELYDGFSSDVFALGVALFAVMTDDYPWRSTKPGECKCYEYVQMRGLSTYFSKRKVRGKKHSVVSDCLSAPLLKLLEGMLAQNPKDRLTLGEQAWKGHGRESVWDKEWLTAPI